MGGGGGGRAGGGGGGNNDMVDRKLLYKEQKMLQIPVFCFGHDRQRQ